MLDPLAPFPSEEVESKTINLRVDRLDKARTHRGPSRRIHFAFEYRKLHPLTMIFADAGHMPQPFGTARPARDIVCDQNEHLPHPGRIGIQITAQMACQ